MGRVPNALGTVLRPGVAVSGPDAVPDALAARFPGAVTDAGAPPKALDRPAASFGGEMLCIPLP